MDRKSYITNKAFCPLPWTGFILESDGNVKNCICSKENLGNLNQKNITEILSDKKNLEIKSYMLNNEEHHNCSYCYSLEKDKKNFNINSSRIYYLKELKDTNVELYNSLDKFYLKHVDIRWSNKCNFSCVYCGPRSSSKWEKELNVKIKKPSNQKLEDFKNYIFSNIKDLSNVYLAGGEPLLMKENEEFLELLLQENPNVNLRINTNLSKTKTKVFELVKQFKNVHWIVSIESVEKEYEYMRFGSKWSDFLSNLEIIKKLDHKITFNMVWTVFNYKTIFNTVDFLKNKGFHNNSFIIGIVFNPSFCNVLNLPNFAKKQVIEILNKRIAEKPGFLLQDSYANLLSYIQKNNLNIQNNFLSEVKKIDTRRGTSFVLTFSELYDIFKKEGFNYD